MPFPKAIATKPYLITEADYREVGQNITLVGEDELAKKIDSASGYASPMLMSWVEPYPVSGENMTMFYTEVSSGMSAGDKVFIIGGPYDSAKLVEKDKYKKGRDGYNVLKVDGCKIALDIPFTGEMPYREDPIDDFIKVYHIDSRDAFVAANRQLTTRDGIVSSKFGYGQNSIAFFAKSFGPIEEWGRNGGVSGAPGFFVREEDSYVGSVSMKEYWNNISDSLIYLGSFSVAESATHKNNGRMMIMNSSFEYGGMEFREGTAYKWDAKKNRWIADVDYCRPVISRSTFRSGRFDGKFNAGSFGTMEKQISWKGTGTWKGGTLINARWESGTMQSAITSSSTMRAEKDQYGIPFQKPVGANNDGFGFNFVIGSEIENSIIQNGNFYKTSFNGSGTASVVESHLLGTTQSHDNRIEKAFFDTCEFRRTSVLSGEIKNARSFDSRFENVKSVNSYFVRSVLKDSTYIGDGVIKVLGYDEWNMSEYRSRTSGTYSYINSPNSKIYKFYISKESFQRLKSKDSFYIKGIKVKDQPSDILLNFFDSKFSISSWSAYFDDLNTGDPSLTKAPADSFYKRGYEISAFLSTPEENSYVIGSFEDEFLDPSGINRKRIGTGIVSENANKGYSIDIVASRHDIFNKSVDLESSSDRLAPIPRDFDYSSDIAPGTASMPEYLGKYIDFSSAYIIDADFASGIVETSDWNSGYHINQNNDLALCGPTSTGIYSISFDEGADRIVVDTTYKEDFWEHGMDGALEKGDIVFIGGLDYDNRGMVLSATLVATGSGYATTNSSEPATLADVSISGITMSYSGSGYVTDDMAHASSKTGSGSGLKLDIKAMPIGSVISITYSEASVALGGSYSVGYSSNIPGYSGLGPIPTASFVSSIVVDSDGKITGTIGATYTVFGPPITVGPSEAFANAVFVDGPSSIGSGLLVKYSTLANGSISSISIHDPGIGYKNGQIFSVEGGSATFSIESTSRGEIYSYSIVDPGQDYRIGDIVEIPVPYRPNFSFESATASFEVLSITVSKYDAKGAAFAITAGLDGEIIALTMSLPGREYREGEIFSVVGGNLDAMVRIDSVTGSISRLPEAYRVEENRNGKIALSEVGTQSVIAGLTGGGIFYTESASNRWNHMSRSKIDRTKIKSGIFRRPYITNSLIKNSEYSSSDKNFQNADMLKSLVVSDALFCSNGNILSSATYIYSNLCGGSDLWNDGIAYMSVLSGMTFSSGTVKSSAWLSGSFTGGTFYSSKSFDAKPSPIERNYLSDSLWLYYKSGEVSASAPIYNGRYAWHDGSFTGGEFYKSDWDSGTFSGGLFHDSKFYSGSITGGIIGTKAVSAEDTRIYNGKIFDATVNNAYVYSEDTSYEGLSSSSIEWMNGVFNGGVFGSNNAKIMGWTESSVRYSANLSALPIKDFKITIAAASVPSTLTDPMPQDFEIDVQVTLKHTYIGDLIINLMAPNGKIINLKKKYSGGSNDNMVDSVFTSDPDSPSIDIWTAPYTGTFKMERLLGQGVYYNLQGNSIKGAYVPPKKDLAPIKGYASSVPSSAYDGDRYLVVATASDPAWAPGQTLFASSFIDKIVEWDSKAYEGAGGWIYPQVADGGQIDLPDPGDRVMTQSGETLIFFGSTWVKSYHSNTTSIGDLLNTDRTVIGSWKLLVMDDAGIDTGFVDDFYISFRYRDSYLIRQYKNDAVWRDGIFNGGQFVDLGVWKSGKFNGGKFISTYGWESSGDYIKSNAPKEDYTWQGGDFNGGEFGNGSLGANSTWYTGAFSGGTFKGRLWNDGIFIYGEFKGGSTLPAIGGAKSANAQAFVDQFRKGIYRGLWRKGVVSEKKEEFVKDQAFSKEQTRAAKPVEKDRKATFDSMLWMSGVFGHQTGEMSNSVWMDGLFRNGKMKSSSFNPYVKRMGDSREFSKDDSCIWENGTFEEGEFFYSKWMQGRFISGTATGMIWKDGITSYMNANNVFWESGLWKNGNWNGSSFEYTGEVQDGFARDILNRGIEWSGTSSCHIWNLFESDSDRTVKFVKSLLDPQGGSPEEVDSFATDNQDDAGINPPYFIGQDLGSSPNSYAPTSDTSISFTIRINKGGAALNKILIAYTSASTPGAALSPSVTIGTDASATVAPGPGTTVVEYAGNISFTEESIQIAVAGLNATSYYSFRAYASNAGGGARSTDIESDVRTVLPVSNVSATVAQPINPHPTTGSLGITTNFTDSNAAGTKTGGVYFSTSNSANLESAGSGVFAGASDPVTITSNSFIASIPYDQLVGNTTYYFKTWVQNGAGKAYSAIGTFKTGSIAPAIVLSDPGSSGVTQVSVTVTNNGSDPLSYGIIVSNASLNLNQKSWSTLSSIPSTGQSGDPTYTKAQTSVQGAQTLIITLPSTLSGNTGYKVTAYAIGLGGLISISATYNMTTATLPAGVTTGTYTSTSTTAMLSGNISSTGGGMTHRGFVYWKQGATQPTATTTQSVGADYGVLVESVTSTGIFSLPATGLIVSQQYRFKAFAISTGVPPSYGSEATFYTLAEAAISNRENLATGVATRSLTATITPTTTGGTTATTSLQFSTNNTFSPLVTALSPNTKYYVRAAAVNAGGTGYSIVEQAWTLADVATVAPENITESSVTAKANVASSSDDQRGISIYTYGNPTARIDHPISSWSGNSGTINIAGLAAGTRYQYEAYLDAADKAGTLLWDKNTSGQGSVQRTYSSMMSPSDTKEFWTLAKISTTANFSYDSASKTISISAVSINNAGGSTISGYGIVWTINGGEPDANTSDKTTAIPSPQTQTSISGLSISKVLGTSPATNSVIKIKLYVKNDQGTYLSQTYNITVPTNGTAASG